MKKNSLNNKSYVTLWIFYHFAILLFFFVTLIFNKGKINIDFNLFNLVPKNFSMKSVQNADEKMLSITSKNVFILVANDDFLQAKKIANNIYEKNKNSDNFESVVLYNDFSELSEITDFLYKYRWNLLDENLINQINENPQNFIDDSLSKIFSGFTLTNLDNLENDPFLLTENHLNSYLNSLQKSGTAMSLKDGVLSSKNENTWYVMIRCVLSQKGEALANKNNGVAQIYKTCELYKDEQTHFVFSGTAFHSHESSLNASKEITIIGVVSLFLVLLILILVFRSVKPILFSMISILISLLIGFCATISFFGKMHIITLVFGTSLIGSCIDYSLHFFTHWAGNKEFTNGSQIRDSLKNGFTMAIISSGICFILLLFAPFFMLKQIALFCLTGLLSSFLTTICIFPLIKLPKNKRDFFCIKNKPPILVNKTKKSIFTNVGKFAILLILVFCGSSIFVCKKNILVQNNLLSLYEMKGELLKNEIEASKIIQYSPSGWFLIEGKSEQDLLQKEEEISKSFNKLNNNNLGFICTSLFVPSIELQKKSQQACKKLIELSQTQFENLGFGLESQEYSKILEKEFLSSQNDFISFKKNNVPSFLQSAISSVNLGKIDEKYYSVLLPNKVDSYKPFKDFADKFDGVYFISKSADISRDLDKLTFMVIQFFMIAYFFMFVILKFVYNLKQTLKIIFVPFLISLMTISIFAICKIPIDFFVITGIILVFGLGLDYVIYMTESEKRSYKNDFSHHQKLEHFATLLSFITTIISFGALALSSFKPVHLIGLTIFIGLSTAYFMSICGRKRV